MARKDQPISAVVATAVVSALLGAICGYGFRYWTEEANWPNRNQGQLARRVQPPLNASMQGPPPGLTVPTFGPNALSLVRTIRALDVIERVQSAGLTSAQRAQLSDVLRTLRDAPTMEDEQARELQARVLGVLTEAQRAAVASLHPRREAGVAGAAQRGRVAVAGTDTTEPGAAFTDVSPFAGGRGREALLSLMGERDTAR